MYVYIETEPNGLWTTGHHTPDGKWHPDQDFDSPEDAASRVKELNGNGTAKQRISIDGKVYDVDCAKAGELLRAALLAIEGWNVMESETGLAWGSMEIAQAKRIIDKATG